MRKTIHFAGLFLLAATYCWAMSMVTHSISIIDLPPNNETREDACFERVTVSFLFHSPQNKITVNNIQCITAQNEKILHHFAWPKQKTLEDIFKTTFIHYIWNTKGFQIRYRKADIIFPFHYFW